MKVKSMNTNYLFIVILVCVFGFTTKASAQFTEQEEQFELSQEQIDQIRMKGAEKTAQMNDFISYMANKNKKYEMRLEKKENALHLFLGNGFKYKEFGEYKEGVMMQITSKRTNEVTSTPLIRKYFQNLIGKLNFYTDVNISSTEVAGIKVGKLRRIDTNEWICTCQYDQVFEGIRDGRLIYRDITTKYVECHVFVEKTELGDEFVVKLGDVYAIDTK